MGTARSKLRLIACLAWGVSVSACFETADPSTPCDAMDLGDADPSSVVASNMAPVLAVAGDQAPLLFHLNCDELADDESECVPKVSALDGLSGGNAVVITSAGNYVVATDRETRNLMTWRVGPHSIQAGAYSAPIDAGAPARLLASLRNSDLVIARDLQGRLVRYDPRDHISTPIARGRSEMMLASVGERHIVGRVVLGEDTEELYVIPVDVPKDDSELEDQLDPVLLSNDRVASRIVVTPNDEFAVVTYGRGDSAFTQVFRIPTGEKVQGWAGAMVSGRDDSTEVPGLRAVSPDGSHVAYRTEQGSLAMRSMDSHSSCLVHSSWNGSSTRIAGFSADGVLYFETEHGTGKSAVNAWTPHRRERRELSSPEEGVTLTAVPARPAGGDDPPWAIGVEDGSFYALQPERPRRGLGVNEAVFLPRDDETIWVLHTKKSDDGRTLGLKRVVPEWSDQLRALSFDDASEPYFVNPKVPEYEEPTKLELPFDSLSLVCMSTGTPGSWAYSCGTAGDRTFLAAPTTPSSERDGGQGDDPEVPAVGDAYECGDGVPAYQSTDPADCRYEVNGCCFGYKGTACNWACGSGRACEATEPSDGNVSGTVQCL